MRLLVTGATGFVGNAIAQRLLGDGHSVSALARDPRRAAHLAEAGAHVCTGSIGDPNDVRAAADGCEVVINAAGARSHGASERALQWVNVAGTENVVRAARHAGARRLVHVSCADVTLQNHDRVYWNEDRVATRAPLGAHARSMLLGEELALAASSRAFHVVAVRPAWLWGPGDTSSLPVMCLEAQQHGAVRTFGRGENLLATTYIGNLVDAVVAQSRRHKWQAVATTSLTRTA